MRCFLYCYSIWYSLNVSVWEVSRLLIVLKSNFKLCRKESAVFSYLFFAVQPQNILLGIQINICKFDRKYSYYIFGALSKNYTHLIFWQFLWNFCLFFSVDKICAMFKSFRLTFPSISLSWNFHVLLLV